MNGNKWILAGGVLNALLAVFHMFFWELFDWPGSLAVLSLDNRGVMQTLNIHLILVFIMFTYVSLFYSREILQTSLGRIVGATIGLFYLLRSVNEFIFWDMTTLVSQISAVVFIGIGLMYLVPVYRNRENRAPVTGGAT